jgi:prolycopene isomerase
MWQVICDRHYGGINYPRGGVGVIARELAEGLVEKGGHIKYKANVTQILMEAGKVVRSVLTSFLWSKMDCSNSYIARTASQSLIQ